MVPHSRCQNDSCICSIRVVVRLVRSLPRADSAMIEALTDSRCSMPVQGVSALDLSQAKPVKTGWDGPGTESRRIGAHPASRKMVPRRCTPPMRKWPRGGDNSSRRAMPSYSIGCENAESSRPFFNLAGSIVLNLHMFAQRQKGGIACVRRRLARCWWSMHSGTYTHTAWKRHRGISRRRSLTPRDPVNSKVYLTHFIVTGGQATIQQASWPRNDGTASIHQYFRPHIANLSPSEAHARRRHPVTAQ